MQAHDLSDGESAGAIAQAAAEALEILQDLLAWQLTPGRWELVEEIVGSMTQASAAGDADALRRATIELELVSPVRVIRLGETPHGPPPEPVRERVNRLIHSLGDAAGSRDDGGTRQAGN